MHRHRTTVSIDAAMAIKGGSRADLQQEASSSASTFANTTAILFVASKRQER